MSEAPWYINRIHELEAEITALKRGIAEVRKSDCERNYAYGEVDWSPIDALLAGKQESK